ncbi:LamG-like jellyroll fold domain-containing protein, partial [Chitinimonas sp. JJ19]|uniref:LamG-like jellyroll fold domain-containing protein n=1 Tax=Chitinimonas sp. JJ19 TaxID=3109352 RepID=UPI003001F13E
MSGTVAPSIGAGVAGSSHGQDGSNVYVNLSNGNLVLQRRDELLVGLGLDANTVRTYNSQARWKDDNNDAWWLSGYRRLANIEGTMGQPGSSLDRIQADGSVQHFVFDVYRYVSTDGAGAHDTLTLDQQGNWVWTDGSSQAREVYESYGSYWRMTSSKDLSGNTLNYVYTGELLSKIITQNGETIEYAYSGRNVTSEAVIKADGTRLTRTYYEYDASNRLEKVTVDLTPEDNAKADGQVYVTTYTYFDGGNLLKSVTQSDGSLLAFTYVPGDERVSTITDALGHVTEFNYSGDVTTVKDARNYITTYSVDAAGRLTSVTAPTVEGLAQRLVYGYDLDGNLLTTTDALNHTVTYGYDTAGNQTSQQDHLGNRIERRYGLKNELLAETVFQQADPDGDGPLKASQPATARFIYDELLNLRFSVSAEGRVTEYRYDVRGQRQSQTQYPSGLFVKDGLLPLHDLTEAELIAWTGLQDKSKTVLEEYVYDARGQLRQTIRYAALDANGVGLEYSKSETTYTYDINGLLLSTIDANTQQTSYAYDGLNRLISTVDANNAATVHTYLNGGQQVTHLLANGRVDTDTYDKAGQLISRLKGGEIPTQYQYDAFGNRVAEIDGQNNATRYVYDAANRLKYTVSALGYVEELKYDAAGRISERVSYATAIDSRLIGTPLPAKDVATPPVADPVPTPSPDPVPGPVPVATNHAAQVFYKKGSNSSISRALGEFKAGDRVTATVRFKAATDTFAGLYLGDAGGTTPYQHEVIDGRYGEAIDGWQTLTVELTMKSDDQLWVFLYGDRDGKYRAAGHNVIYDEVSVVSVQRGAVLKEDFESGLKLVSDFNATTGWNSAGQTTNWIEAEAVQAPVPTTYNARAAKVWYKKSNNSSISRFLGNFQAGDQVTATVRFKAPANTHAALYLGDADGAIPEQNQVYGGSYGTDTGEWKTLTVNLTVKNDDELWVYLISDRDGKNRSIDHNVIFDDVQVTSVKRGTVLNDGFEDGLKLTENHDLTTGWYSSGSKVELAQFAPPPAPMAAATPAAPAAPAPTTPATTAPVAATTSLTPPASLGILGADGAIDPTVLAALLVPTASQDKHTRLYYDPAGRLARTVDAAGAVVTFEYDSAGRLNREIRHANQLAQQPLVGASLDSFSVEASRLDRVTQQYYDKDGKLIYAIDGEGYITAYRYDGAGRQIERAQFLSATVDYYQVMQDVRAFWRLDDAPGTQAKDVLASVGHSAVNGEYLEGERIVLADGKRVMALNGSGQGAKLDGHFSSGGAEVWFRPTQPVQDGEAIILAWSDSSGTMLSALTLGPNNTLHYTDNGQQIDLGITLKQGSWSHLAVVKTEWSVQLYVNGQPVQSLSTAGATSYFEGQLVLGRNIHGQFSDAAILAGSISPESVAQHYAFGNQDLNNVPVDPSQFERLSSGNNNLRHNTVYDAQGRVTAEIDAAGYLTRYTYDAVGNKLSQRRYANAMQEDIRAYAMNAGGGEINALDEAVVMSVMGEFQTTHYTYTKLHQLETTRLSYTKLDAADQPVATFDPNTTRYVYDQMGQQTAVRLADKTSDVRATLIRYNQLGQVIGELSAEHAPKLDGLALESSINAVWDQYGTQYKYDIAGRRISSSRRDDVGKLLTTVYYYDSQSRLLGSINADGEVTQRGYNALGQIILSYTYAKRVPVAELANYTGGLIDQKTIDLVEAMADARYDQVIRYRYNARGELIETVTGSQSTEIRRHNAFGEIVGTVNPHGEGYTDVQTMDYDRRGLLTRTETQLEYQGPVGEGWNSAGYAVGKITTNTYDAFGRLTDVKANGGRDGEYDGYTYYYYDALGRVTGRSGGGQLGRTTDYDAYGRVIAEGNGQNLTTYAYDPIARTVTVRTPEGMETVTTRNRFGETIAVKDAMGAITRYSYDRDGRLKSVSRPYKADGSEINKTTYQYDRLGNQVQVQENRYRVAGQNDIAIDGNGIVTTFKFDAAGRVISRTVDPAGLNQTTIYTLDGQGRKVTETAHDGTRTEVYYDDQGRVKATVLDAQGAKLRTAFAYDGAGNLISVIKGANEDDTPAPGAIVEKNFYDALGRRVMEHRGDNVIEYVYNAYDVMVGKTVNGDSTIYVHGNNGLLDITINGSGDAVYYQYDNNGALTRTRKYSNSGGVPAYNLTGWLVGDTVHEPEWTAQDSVTRYVNDKDGHRLWTIDAEGGATRHYYDKNGRLEREVRYANRFEGEDTGQALRFEDINLTASAQDRETVYTYDALGRPKTTTVNGRLISSIESYDHADRVLVSVDALGGRTTYQYDVLGREKLRTEPDGDVVQTLYDDVNRTKEERRSARLAVDWSEGKLLRNPDGSATYLGPDGEYLTVNAGVDPITLARSSRAIARSWQAGYGLELAYVLPNNDPSRAFSNLLAGYWSNTASYPAGSVVSLAGGTLTRNADGSATYVGASKQSLHLTQAMSAGEIAAMSRDIQQFIGYTNPVLVVVNSGRLAELTADLQAFFATPVVDEARAQVSKYYYDRAGRLEKVEHGEGSSTLSTERYRYYASGLKQQYTNARNDSTDYAYDTSGQLTHETGPAVRIREDSNAGFTTIRKVVQYQYDGKGNLTAKIETQDGNLFTGAEGQDLSRMRITYFQYDGAGRQVALDQAGSGSFNGGIKADPYNSETPFDKATLESVFGGATVDRNQALYETSSRDIRTTFYDRLGRAVAHSDAEGHYSYKVYDRLGQLRYEIDALGYATAYRYNAFGDVIEKTRHSRSLLGVEGLELLSSGVGTERGFTVTEVQDALAYVAAQPREGDPVADRTISYEHDNFGRVIKQIDPAVQTLSADGSIQMLSRVTEFAYDARGLLVSQTVTLDNYQSAVTGFFYDELGRKVGEINAEGYLSHTVYDGFGNVLQVAQYAKRLDIPWSSGTPLQLLIANVAGQQGNGGGESRIERYSYDRFGRKLSEIKLNVSDVQGVKQQVRTGYRYDVAGNQIAIVDARGNSSYQILDAQGRLIYSLAATGSDANGLLYTLSEVSYDALGNAVRTVRYGTAIRQSQLSATPETMSVAAVDALAQSVRNDLQDRVEKRTYDMAGRAITLSIDAGNVSGGGTRKQWFYDKNGQVVLEWQGNIDADGQARNNLLSHLYDATGRLVQTLERNNGLTGQTGYTRTANVHNGFGEVTERSVTAETQEAVVSQNRSQYWYDRAGNAWARKENGVSSFHFHNLAGQETGRLLSPEKDLWDFGGLIDADHGGPSSSLISAMRGEGAFPVSAASLRRTYSSYDKLGNLTGQRLPAFSNEVGAGLAIPTIVTTKEAGGSVALGRDEEQVGTDDDRPDLSHRFVYVYEITGTWTAIPVPNDFDSLTAEVRYSVNGVEKVHRETHPSLEFPNGAAIREPYDPKVITNVVWLGTKVYATKGTVTTLVRDDTREPVSTLRYPTETNDGSQTWLRLRYDNGTTQIVPLGRGAFDSATQAIWAQHAVSDLIPSGAMGLEVEVYSLAPGATLPEAGLDKATAEQSLRGLSSYRMTKHPSTGEWQITAIPNSAAQTKRESFTVTHTPTQSFAYDRWGSRIAATDALGVTTRWHYNLYGQVTDQLGAVVARVDEHGKIEWAAQTNHYRYNEFGELRYSIDGNGDVTRFDYNRLGSKTAQGYLQRSNQPAWANDGRSVRDGYFVAAQNWRYDELGRLAAHQSNTALAETRYSYNTLDKIIRSEQQGSSWVLNADNDGTTMQDYTAVVDYRYNGAGQREVETRYRADQPLNRQELHQRYDAADRVIQNQNKEYRDGILVSSGLLRSYRYNELGNKIAESVTGTIKTTASDGTVTYSTPTDSISWTYENGQMIRSTDLASNITSYEYNSA